MKKKDLTPEEAIDYIEKRLRLKFIPSDMSKYRRTVRNYNSLKRILELVKKDIFISKYSTKEVMIHSTRSGHNWIDFFVKDELVTFQFDWKK